MWHDDNGKIDMTRYPQYQIGQWIDTSEESMNNPHATILYGVQIRPERGAKWMHCCRGSAPLIYDTPEKAREAIAELKAADVVAANAELTRRAAATENEPATNGRVECAD